METKNGSGVSALGKAIAEPKNLTMERLEDQLNWYEGMSAWNQKMFKRLKIIEIVAAVLIPFLAGLGAVSYIIGALGIVVVVMESLESIYQFQNKWISYRTMAERLRHEKYLYLAQAGPYMNLEDYE
jgi:hypothetical protein